MANNPEVLPLAIVVPAFKEAETIKGFLGSLCELQKLGKQEVIAFLVNDGSDDDTSRLAKSWQQDNSEKFKLNIINTKHNGIAMAFHEGVSQAIKAGAELIVRTDVDTRLAPNYVVVASKAFENPALKLIGGRLIAFHDEDRRLGDNVRIRVETGLRQIVSRKLIIPGNNMVMRSEAYLPLPAADDLPEITDDAPHAFTKKAALEMPEGVDSSVVVETVESIGERFSRENPKGAGIDVLLTHLFLERFGSAAVRKNSLLVAETSMRRQRKYGAFGMADYHLFNSKLFKNDPNVRSEHRH